MRKAEFSVRSNAVGVGFILQLPVCQFGLDLFAILNRSTLQVRRGVASTVIKRAARTSV